jgi:hypothetical protein
MQREARETRWRLRLGRPWSALVLLASAAVACSSVSPRTGAERKLCSTYTAACAPEGLTGCDYCEAINCCDTRRACYNDVDCGCADSEADDCLGAAMTPDAVVACWAAFAASGQAAQQRIACERAYCQDDCAVPSAAAIEGSGTDAAAD